MAHRWEVTGGRVVRLECAGNQRTPLRGESMRVLAQSGHSTSRVPLFGDEQLPIYQRAHGIGQVVMGVALGKPAHFSTSFTNCIINLYTLNFTIVTPSPPSFGGGEV